MQSHSEGLLRPQGWRKWAGQEKSESEAQLQRTEEDINKVKSILDDDNRVTVREIHEATGLSQGTAHRILTKTLASARLQQGWSQGFVRQTQGRENLLCQALP
ncbi:Hypothetical protein FKW44_000482 [Caligus rogercresseyi]|uniref:HTH iclR-type domain-containing protein n=1 Tax=Caligus rogercresseyi TaxID=217165 RepID=A0A7T8QUW1_CALRO|nr:Hypothetical protein FKW44_000482 [Caligus rogercresseyi]